jgi:hypothetical protein
MYRETIRSTPYWKYGQATSSSPRYDCVFLTKDDSQPGMRGLHVARVLLFFSFSFSDVVYPCALVHWFIPIDDNPDSVTGMWVVKPEYDASGQRVIEVVHLNSILRGAHLLPVFGSADFIPADICYTESLDIFKAYYVNKYIDHHAYEIAF